jgi:adenylate cyclase
MHPVLVGRPVEGAVAGEKAASGGDVIVSQHVWSLLPPERQGEPHGDYMRLSSVPPPGPRRPPSLMRIELPVLEQCAKLVHPLLFKKITTSLQEFVSDFREVTSVFLCYDGLSYDGDIAGFFPATNEFFQFVERESSHYGGILLQTDFTDKGNVLFVLFGAPNAQENKELLAVRLARKILKEKDRFPRIGNIQIGIATGNVFCGNMGSPSRRGYTAAGEAVNLSARLMTHSKETGILFDAGTERKLRAHFVTALVEHASLKGHSKPVAIYRVDAEIPHMRGLVIEEKSPIIGRLKELKTLSDLAQGAFEGEARLCILFGEAGIGKSRLAGKLISDAPSLGLESRYGICYSYERFTPFYPWKELLVLFFQLFDSESPEVQLAKIGKELAGMSGFGPEWTSVLARIVGLPVEEHALTRGMDPRRKNQQVFQIIFRLLQERSKDIPLLLVFEDLHWADDISLSLIDYVVSRMNGMRLMILCTARPSDTLSQLRSLPSVHAIDLTHLDPDETRTLVRTKLGIEPPNLALEDLVAAKVQGNPFFVESIVESLIELSFVGPSVRGGMQLLKGLNEITIPDSIQGVVLSRIDRLGDTEKAVLKVASVVGRLFNLDAVLALLQSTVTQVSVRDAMDELNELGLTLLELEEPFTCLFKHIVIRDVAYNTLLVSVREDLHRRLARYMEERAGDNPQKVAAILAYHCLAGVDETKGLHYTLLAARSAKEQYANKDAIYHYTKALELLSKATSLGAEALAAQTRQAKRELAETLVQAGNYAGAIELFQQCLDHDLSRVERAEIYIGLGRVYQEKGDTDPAIQNIEKALRLLGRRTPRTLLELVAKISVQLFVHALYVLFPWIVPPVPEAEKSAYLKQLTTLITLIRIYYFVDIAKLTWSTMLALNMAGRARSEYGLSLAGSYYGTMLFGSGLLERSKLQCEQAAVYARQAKDLVAEGVALARRGVCSTFANELDEAIEFLQQGVDIFRQVGEMWELQTTTMLMATTHFLRSELATGERLYTEMGETGRELNALMHQAWSHSWAPFCRYLLGKQESSEVLPELEEGYRISGTIKDLANQCASLNHMANVAVRDQRPEEAARAAVRAFDSIRRYQVLVPFLQIGLVDSAEAALFALEEGATSVPRSELVRIVRRGIMKARGIGTLYPYMRGPTLRVRARYARWKHGEKRAEPLFVKALEVLAKSLNRWETGVAYLDGAAALPHRREDWLKRAEAIFVAIGAKRELLRVERLRGAAKP